MSDIKATLNERLRCIPDFPIKGINFRDITSWFKDPECISLMAEDLLAQYRDKGITKVVGLESRGFLMGAILGKELGAGIILARKPGKLPLRTVSQSYEKEYGSDSLEIEEGAISEDDVVLIHDDLLATGGTAMAALRLVEQFHPKRIYLNFLIEIRDEGLHGRELFPSNVPIYCILTT